MEDINRKCVVYIRLREVLMGIVFFLTFATEISVEYSSSNNKEQEEGSLLYFIQTNPLVQMNKWHR